MYKIVILGCENSHANAFLNFIRDDSEFSDIEVAGVYSDDADAAKALNETYGVNVMSSSDEFVGKVDGIVVTARHGAKHLGYAKPYLKDGVAVFMDKPITVSEDEAVEMMKLFTANGNKFTGGSVLKYAKEVVDMKKAVADSENGDTISGVVKAPIIMKSEHGGLYFYAQHLVEMVCEIYGRFPKSVIACQNDKSVTVVFRYDSYDITGIFTEECFTYYVCRIATEINSGAEVNLGDEHFKEEFYHFAKCLRGESTNPDCSEFIAPVFIMNAIERSLASGKEEKVNAM